jgi:hypothetical protein
VVGEAGDGEDAVAEAARLRPDVVLMGRPAGASGHRERADVAHPRSADLLWGNDSERDWKDRIFGFFTTPSRISIARWIVSLVAGHVDEQAPGREGPELVLVDEHQRGVGVLEGAVDDDVMLGKELGDRLRTRRIDRQRARRVDGPASSLFLWKTCRLKLPSCVQWFIASQAISIRRRSIAISPAEE